MMKYLILPFLLLTTFTHAETIKDRIHSIEDGIIKFQNGRVAFLNSSTNNLLHDDLIEARLDEDSNLLSYEKLDDIQDIKRMSLQPEETPTPTTPPVFEPTIVPSMAEVQKIYDRSNPYYKRVSECTDRAHVWAHEEFKLSGTKSRKAFVFFTASYINSVHFKWWFHVAPMYTVKTPKGNVDIVTDFRYMHGPATVKEWTDSFVYTKRPCKVTTKFSEYDVNPQTENCYLIFESMHYKIPGEIFEQERSHRYKTETSEYEVNAARRFGFQL